MKYTLEFLMKEDKETLSKLCMYYSNQAEAFEKELSFFKEVQTPDYERVQTELERLFERHKALVETADDLLADNKELAKKYQLALEYLSTTDICLNVDKSTIYKYSPKDWDEELEREINESKS